MTNLTKLNSPSRLSFANLSSYESNIITNSNQCQTIYFRWFQKDIFDADLTRPCKELLVFMQLIAVEGFVKFDGILRRWRMSSNASHTKIPSQLRTHLKTLETDGYIQKYKNGRELCGYTLNYKRLNSEKIVYIRNSITEDLTLTLSDIFVLCSRITFQYKDLNFNRLLSKKVGMDRNTFTKYSNRLKLHGYLVEYRMKYKKWYSTFCKVKDEHLLLFKRKITTFKSKIESDDFSAHNIINKLINITSKIAKKINLKERGSKALQMRLKLPKTFSSILSMPEDHKNFILNSIKSRLKHRKILGRIRGEFDVFMMKLISANAKKKEYLTFANSFHLIAYFSAMIEKLIAPPKEPQLKFKIPDIRSILKVL